MARGKWAGDVANDDADATAAGDPLAQRRAGRALAQRGSDGAGLVGQAGQVARSDDLGALGDADVQSMATVGEVDVLARGEDSTCTRAAWPEGYARYR